VDVVEDGHDGLLVPPRDPAALARALQRVLDDPALRAALAAHARRKLECRFTVEHAARSTKRLYHDLLALRSC
jgi:glycosyltransferase involved in cell wall biosynthesis